jgi:hypothetical protein
MIFSSWLYSGLRLPVVHSLVVQWESHNNISLCMVCGRTMTLGRWHPSIGERRKKRSLPCETKYSRLKFHNIWTRQWTCCKANYRYGWFRITSNIRIDEAELNHHRKDILNFVDKLKSYNKYLEGHKCGLKGSKDSEWIFMHTSFWVWI